MCEKTHQTDKAKIFLKKSYDLVLYLAKQTNPVWLFRRLHLNWILYKIKAVR